MKEQVNHPSHYNQGKYEIIEVIEDSDFDFHLGNTLKYLCRAGKKDSAKLVEDLKKSLWYAERKLVEVKNPRDIKFILDASDIIEDQKLIGLASEVLTNLFQANEALHAYTTQVGAEEKLVEVIRSLKELILASGQDTGATL